MLDYTLCFKKGVKLLIKKCKLQNFLAPVCLANLIYNQYKEDVKFLHTQPLAADQNHPG